MKVDSATHGTLVAQGLCGRTAVMGSFRGVGGTPVILLRQNGRDIALDREVPRELTWMPAITPGDRAFSIH